MTATASGQSYARAGLLGNPSDIYEGKAIAFTFENYRARVLIESAPGVQIGTAGHDRIRAPHLSRLPTPPRRPQLDGAAPLLLAACRRFRSTLPALGEADTRGEFRMTWQSDIPYQVGLAGSSALIVAALRALAQWFAVDLGALQIAILALEAETLELGITAGPMDRLAQSFEGVLLMDFGKTVAATRVTRIDPKTLPPLFVVWDPSAGETSDSVHRDVRDRWLEGDPALRQAIATFPRFVDKGLVCLERGDTRGLRAAINGNFDTRASIWSISERDRRMIQIARAQGAAAKFCGSGGAVVGVLENPARFSELAAAYSEAGYNAIEPLVSPAAGGET